MMKEVYFTDRALSAMEKADWPGNTRQLKSAVMAVVAVSAKDEIDVDDLADEMCARRKWDKVKDSALELSKLKDNAVADIERDYLISILRKTRGVISQTAAEAGIARQNLTKKLKKLGINAEDYRK